MNMKRWLGNTLQENRYWIVAGSAMLVGLMLLVSGAAMLPGQTEFADALLKSLWTPTAAYFISYYLPWVEICLGIFLLLGLFPRIVATLCVPLILGFIANNCWALNNSIDNFPECAYCVVLLEEVLGTISPLGALILDIVLLCLALVVLLLHQEDFSTFRPWFIKRKKK